MSGAADRNNVDSSADNSTRLPSDVVEPTRVETPSQQAATQPGSGSTSAEVGETQPNTGKVPFKEQVLGYAKKTRGTLFGNAETKDTGDKILGGHISAKDAMSKKA